jgi:hypothetical protein
LAWDKTGSNKAARMAMMAMTTNSSINVNPRFTSGFGISALFCDRSMAGLSGAGQLL